jgi:hypothetical protein
VRYAHDSSRSGDIAFKKGEELTSFYLLLSGIVRATDLTAEQLLQSGEREHTEFIGAGHDMYDECMYEDHCFLWRINPYAVQLSSYHIRDLRIASHVSDTP